jgi:hypothetical protein
MKAHQMDGKQICPHCYSKLDGAMNIASERGPSPGAVTVCAYCQVPLVFTRTLKLRLLSDDDIDRLSNDELISLVVAQALVARPHSDSDRRN